MPTFTEYKADHMETKQQKPLPVGIQTFDKLIEGGYLYVDKTAYLYSRCRGPYTYWSCGYGDAHGQDIIPLRVEIKSSAEATMNQIDLKDYPSRFTMCGLPIIKVSINFDSEKRTIVDRKIVSQ